MSGLNCGRPSLVAWPTVSRGIDILIAVDDEPAREAMRLMAESGVESGETGAAGLGGLLELLRAEEEEGRRAGRLAWAGRLVSCSSTARAPPTPMPIGGSSRGSRRTLFAPSLEDDRERLHVRPERPPRRGFPLPRE